MPSVILDHIAMRVMNLAQGAEQWRSRGQNVSFRNPSLAIVEMEDGTRLALLGEDSGHPNHVALRVSTEEELSRRALIEGAEIKAHDDGSRSFYTRGGIGLALEWIWRPETARTRGE